MGPCCILCALEGIDQVRLAFDASSLKLLNVVIGGLLFGVALDLGIDDFKRVLAAPKAPAIGLACQFLLLPAMTFLLTLILDPAPSIALGMILVAACPGGNLSNYFTWLAKGDAALSVGMSAISTAAAILLTPLNITFWGSLNPSTAPLLAEVSVDPLQMLMTVGTVLGIPLVLGMTVAAKAPRVAAALRKPFKIGSLIFFFVFIGILFQKNVDHFVGWIHLAFLPVMLQNAMALGTGWGAARAAGLPSDQRRAVAIEVGIQNSGLGLLLVFEFFDGLGGMAFIAAWWGIWHIIAGMTLAGFWSRRPH